MKTMNILRHVMVLLMVLIGTAVWPFPASVPAAIEVGETAPEPVLMNDKGEAARLLKEVKADDAATSVVTMLLFVKSDDRYASDTLAALDELLERHEELGEKLDRVFVLTRKNGFARPAILDQVNQKKWRIVVDDKDQAYAGYKIIATPTIILVTPDRKVAGVHPGYDHGMPQHVRLALAELMGVELPRATVEKPEKPNMMLQMGRQMAKRGLWDRALEYYEKVESEGAISPGVMMEKAEVLIQLNQLDEAETVISQATGGDAARAEALLKKIAELKEAKPGTSAPPKINR